MSTTHPRTFTLIGEFHFKFLFETFPQQWLMSHSSGVNGSAVASIQPMGTGALMWTINKDICNRNTLQPFDALMTVCTVSFWETSLISFKTLNRETSSPVTLMENVFQWRRDVISSPIVQISLMKMNVGWLCYQRIMLLTTLHSLSMAPDFSKKFK